MLIKGTTLKVEVPLEVEVELQLVDAKLVVELVEVVDEELVLLEVFEELVLLEVVELLFDVVELEEETEERPIELEEVMRLEVVEELDFGAERIAYAPTPAITTITTTIKAIARGASPPLF